MECYHNHKLSYKAYLTGELLFRFGNSFAVLELFGYAVILFIFVILFKSGITCMTFTT